MEGLSHKHCIMIGITAHREWGDRKNGYGQSGGRWRKTPAFQWKTENRPPAFL